MNEFRMNEPNILMEGFGTTTVFSYGFGTDGFETSI
jgi:hypothetical protein